MKILHVVTLSELGGSQSVIISLSVAAVADGHKVMVVASSGGGLWEILPQEVQQWPIDTLTREINPFCDFKTYRKLKKIYRKFCPDVIHLHSSKIGVLGRIAFPRDKIIYTVHGFDSIRIAYRRFLPLEKILQRSCAHIVAVSRYDYMNLIAEGISRSVTYIYNGIEDYQSILSQPLPATIESYGKRIEAGKSFAVICIARISPQKKFDLFCEVAQSLIEQDIDFYWIGNKEVPGNLPENVHCLGEIPNAHQLIPYSDLFFLPSHYEGLPISILESLCYGVPVIASDVGGVPEILNGKNGFSLKNDVEAFRQVILYYKTKKAIHKSAGNEARLSFLSHFTVNRMYRSYLALYESILRSRS
ncbi:glycosyltransferase [Persicitalea jodogahamensis]|uniref:Glycosyl transferase n=1 Tax=Persicitalea jodogahamensis TaxID=402147 RepID=A0A8J3G905_9BACT|nr:glycosyltransferase [Persicitalea jodogahamensis]GHB59243.1 glycosyl transferase [Persicitalea jodogahamensis]